MLIATETKTGTTLTGAYTPDLLASFVGSFQNQQFHSDHGEPNIVLASDVQALLQREQVRKNIDQVGDAGSREGVLSDVLGIVVVGISQLTVALSKAKTLADVNAAAAPLAEIGAVIDSAVKSGALKMTYMVKPGGAQGVLADMVALSNGVSAVLSARHPAQ